jgi:hypothetical protein
MLPNTLLFWLTISNAVSEQSCYSSYQPFSDLNFVITQNETNAVNVSSKHRFNHFSNQEKLVTCRQCFDQSDDAC